MSDQSTHAGSASGGAGSAGSEGAGDDSSQSNKQTQNPPPKVVPWDVHERLLGDVAKTREKNRELEARIGEIESNSLKEKNDYKSLYERADADNKELKKKLSDQSNWMISTQQFGAVKAEAVAAGLKKEALDDLDLIDMKGVDVETTSTGRFLVKGAKERVERLKTEKPHWFGETEPPRVNAGGTGAGSEQPGKRVSVDDVVQAERDFKARKITETQYKAIYNRYVKENPRKAMPGQEPPRTPQAP